jgi:sarcosine oxidase, subunit alpha
MPELVWQHQTGDGLRLVGIQPSDAGLVPAEACQIVNGRGTIEGRITSSRFSPTLGRSICLGLVTKRLATAGTTVTIRLPNGAMTTGRVMEQHAHFDHDGSRLRG